MFDWLFLGFSGYNSSLTGGTFLHFLRLSMFLY